MRNSSYNFIPILLKLCRHCDHALKICMWLGYTPQINYTPGIYKVYRGYIVFVFSVKMFVCVCACVCKLFSVKDFSGTA